MGKYDRRMKRLEAYQGAREKAPLVVVENRKGQWVYLGKSYTPATFRQRRPYNPVIVDDISVAMSTTREPQGPAS